MTVNPDHIKTCIACEGPAYAKFRIGSYRIHKCSKCSSFTYWPRPTLAQLAEAYAHAGPGHEISLRAGDPNTLVPDDIHVRHLLTCRVPNGRFLDVGCGMGHLMRQALLIGFEPYGVDLSEQHIHAARTAYGLKEATFAAIEDVDFPNAFFDVVTMFALIEHLREPRKTLERIGSLLKPGGRLLIQTDNARSLSYLLRRSGWPFFTPPIHLQNFTPRGLSALVESCGFHLSRVITEWSIQPSQVSHTLGLPLSLSSALVMAFSPASYFAQRLGHGELITLTAVKPAAVH